MQKSALLNDTLSKSTIKVDCAKECPCGVPTIPVPDQWLEVMVTGGFKVWHIIFIIIAFLVTMVVVYCCFHRCRIPRTKQEIEADLMRSNLASKFRDYLQELPNEPTTFVEALKKVQDIEEKMEQDDAMMSRDLGARKRMGWLKLKGKGGEKAAAEGKQPEEPSNKVADNSVDPIKNETTTTQKSETTEESIKKVMANGLAINGQGNGKVGDTIGKNSIDILKAQASSVDNKKVDNNNESENNKNNEPTNQLDASGDSKATNGTKVASSGAKAAKAKARKPKPNLSRTKGHKAPSKQRIECDGPDPVDQQSAIIGEPAIKPTEIVPKRQPTETAIEEPVIGPIKPEAKSTDKKKLLEPPVETHHHHHNRRHEHKTKRNDRPIVVEMSQSKETHKKNK